MPVDRVTGGQVVASEWGNQVSDAVAAIEARLAALEAQKPTMGLLPSAFPMGFSPEDASDAVHDIPVLVGALAGAIAVPIIVEASLRLEAYAVRVGKGAPSGEHVQAEIHLYYDVGTTILQEIPGSGDYFDTYLSGADANLNSNGAVALDLAPGAYWCAVRNIRADTIFPVRYRGYGEFRSRNSLKWASLPQLGATLDTSAAIRDIATLFSVKLNGVAAAVPQMDPSEDARTNAG